VEVLKSKLLIYEVQDAYVESDVRHERRH
jgi:hypothetical protein